MTPHYAVQIATGAKGAASIDHNGFEHKGPPAGIVKHGFCGNRQEYVGESPVTLPCGFRGLRLLPYPTKRST
jgi:hypothetical protein